MRQLIVLVLRVQHTYPAAFGNLNTNNPKRFEGSHATYKHHWHNIAGRSAYINKWFLHALASAIACRAYIQFYFCDESKRAKVYLYLLVCGGGRFENILRWRLKRPFAVTIEHTRRNPRQDCRPSSWITRHNRHVIEAKRREGSLKLCLRCFEADLVSNDAQCILEPMTNRISWRVFILCIWILDTNYTLYIKFYLFLFI